MRKTSFLEIVFFSIHPTQNLILNNPPFCWILLFVKWGRFEAFIGYRQVFLNEEFEFLEIIK